MRQSVSVIMPTVEWTTACEEVAAQLRPGDELLVIHDEPTDPVASREGSVPDGVRVIEAGPPEGCSGKANAILVGMETAANDLLVWTDDDFHHPPDWIDTMVDDYERQGPTTELPVFVGGDPLSKLLEPAFQIIGTLGVYAEKYAWGGAVVFGREDIDEAAFREELGQAVSDDALLGEYLDLTAASRTREIPAGTDFDSTVERVVRYEQIAFHHVPASSVGSLLLTAVVIGLCLVSPLVTGLVTLGACAMYARFGIRRASALFVVPALAVTLLLRTYGLMRPTIVWGGRRYAYRGKLDVEVLDAE